MVIISLRVLLALLVVGLVHCFKTKWVKNVLASGIIASTIHTAPAQAFGIFTSNEQSTVNNVASFQRPVNELFDNLRPSEVPNAVGVYMTQQVLKGCKCLFMSLIYVIHSSMLHVFFPPHLSICLFNTKVSRIVMSLKRMRKYTLNHFKMQWKKA